MWYNKLNFEENPFEDNEFTKLIDCEEILEEVDYRINSGGILIIEAKEGQGKTAVLKQAINKFGGLKKIAYIDSTLVIEPNIENVLIQKYGLFGRLFKKKPKGMILLIDDMDKISEKNNERIKYFYDQNYIKSIVITTTDEKKLAFSESLKHRISKKIKLKELTEENAVEVVNSRLNEPIFDEEVIKETFKLSNKNPKEFLRNMNKLAEEKIENNKEITKGDVKEILGLGQKSKKPKKEDKKKKEDKNEPKIEIINEEPKPEIKIDEEKEVKVVYEDVAERYY